MKLCREELVVLANALSAARARRQEQILAEMAAHRWNIVLNLQQDASEMLTLEEYLRHKLRDAAFKGLKVYPRKCLTLPGEGLC